LFIDPLAIGIEDKFASLDWVAARPPLFIAITFQYCQNHSSFTEM